MATKHVEMFNQMGMILDILDPEIFWFGCFMTEELPIPEAVFNLNRPKTRFFARFGD
jgi:hypothetical protein